MTTKELMTFPTWGALTSTNMFAVRKPFHEYRRRRKLKIVDREIY